MINRARQLPRALFWLGFLLLVVGMVVNTLWRQIVPEPTLFLSKLVLASLLLAVIVGRVLRCAMANALLVIWLLALAYFTGFAAFTTVMLIGVAAMGIGSLLVPPGMPARSALSVLVGLALICGIDGWLLPFRIHFRPVYVVAFLVILILRWRAVVPMLRIMSQQWIMSVAAAPGWALLAVSAIGAMSTFAWLPTLDFDSLAYHLNLPSQLVELGYYQMNVDTNVWALSPWMADVLQATAWIMAGVEARGAVDALWAALSLALIWKLCEEMGLKPALCWLALALYASIPTIAYPLDAMQTEGPTLAVMAALALVIQRVPFPDRRVLMLLAALFGLLIGLKVSNLMFAGPLGLWLLWRCRLRLPWRFVPIALLLMLAVAGSSYAFAYGLTGNPVPPLFNGVFHSPFFAPGNWHDDRWNSGFHWNIIWRVVFHSSDYVEGGAAPVFVLVALSGSFLVALVRPTSRALALIALVTLLLPLYEIQYTRYAVPAFALLIPAMLCGLPRNRLEGDRPSVEWFALGALVVMSFCCLSGISWQQKDGVLRKLIMEGQVAVIQVFAPTRLVAEFIHDHYGITARTLVLGLQNPFVAGYAGRAFTDSWYDWQLQELVHRANVQSSEAGWSKVLEFTGADLLLVRKDQNSTALMAAIEANRGGVADETGDFVLWWLDPGSSGKEVPAGAHALLMKFDTAVTPPAQTLVDAYVTMRCDPVAALKGHIVISWLIGQGGQPTYSKYTWATCLQNNTATTSVHVAVRYKVTAMTVLANPEPSMDMGLVLMDSRAAFRRDLMAERDMSQQAHDVLQFHKNRFPPTASGL